eukprot:13299393-Ditylum_brightwellii.AAC.1
MQVNEGGPDPMNTFTSEHSNCLHYNVCMLATGDETINPYVGVSRRRDDIRRMIPGNDGQHKLEELE